MSLCLRVFCYLPQGSLSCNRHRNSKAVVVRPPTKPAPPAHSFGDDDEADDTSNDAFYSAAEERADSQNPTPPDEDSADNLESELSGTDGGDLSDDGEDIIALKRAFITASIIRCPVVLHVRDSEAG